MELQLFSAYFNLKKYSDVIKIGEKLLEEDFNKRFLDLKNKEALLADIIISCLERGKVDSNSYKKAKEIIQKYKLETLTFEFKIGIESEIYLVNNGK